MGCEFCGVIKEKGSNVRDDLKIGDKVWGVVMPHKPGSQAEFIVVDQKNVRNDFEKIYDFHIYFITFTFVMN